MICFEGIAPPVPQKTKFFYFEFMNLNKAIIIFIGENGVKDPEVI
jgi:hypothetical protein